MRKYEHCYLPITANIFSVLLPPLTPPMNRGRKIIMPLQTRMEGLGWVKKLFLVLVENKIVTRHAKKLHQILISIENVLTFMSTSLIDQRLNKKQNDRI